MLENIVMVQKRLSEAVKMRLRAARMLQAGKGCAEVALERGRSTANRVHLEAAAG